MLIRVVKLYPSQNHLQNCKVKNRIRKLKKSQRQPKPFSLKVMNTHCHTLRCNSAKSAKELSQAKNWNNINFISVLPSRLNKLIVPFVHRLSLCRLLIHIWIIVLDCSNQKPIQLRAVRQTNNLRVASKEVALQAPTKLLQTTTSIKVKIKKN